jgi:hypothetical protein
MKSTIFFGIFVALFGGFPFCSAMFDSGVTVSGGLYENVVIEFSDTLSRPLSCATFLDSFEVPSLSLAIKKCSNLI